MNKNRKSLFDDKKNVGKNQISNCYMYSGYKVMILMLLASRLLEIH